MQFRSVVRVLRTPHVGAAPLLWCLLLLLWSGTALAALTHTELISDVMHGREPGVSARPPAMEDAFAIVPERPSPTHLAPLLNEHPEAPLAEECGECPPELVLADIALEPPPAADTRMNNDEAQRAEARRNAWVRSAEHESEHLAVRERAEADWQAEDVVPQWLEDARQPDSRYRADLNWLKDYQHPDGYWSASTWHLSDSLRARTALTTGNVESWGLHGDAGPADGDVETTAVALLVYLGAGYDHKCAEYRVTCRSAILWLRAAMDEHGRFKAARGTRDQALATMALCEAYGLSGDAVVKPLAEKAVQALLAMRVTDSGWGARPGIPADVVSTFHAICALKTARMAGLVLDTTDVYSDVGRFLSHILTVQDGRYTVACADGEADPVNGFQRRPIGAAAWVCAALYTGHADLKHPAIRYLSGQLSEPGNLPAWEHGRVDYEYWWVGSLALYQVGGEQWKGWSETLSNALLDHQRGYHVVDKARAVAPAEHGSWDPVDLWLSGGRVAATGYASLTLKTFYMYLRLKGGAED